MSARAYMEAYRLKENEMTDDETKKAVSASADPNCKEMTDDETKEAIRAALRSREMQAKSDEVLMQALRDRVQHPHMGEREPMLRHFRFAHLRSEDMKSISRGFAMLALQLVERLPASPERTVALRKMVEAKDCAVRAMMDVEEGAL